MQKILSVETEIQKAIFENVLLPEITSGFWKNVRPYNHADFFKDVSVMLGQNLGTFGFKCSRSYNFINPDFFKKNEERLLNVAQQINKNITKRQLRKQLISLNEILKSRQGEVNDDGVKPSRRKRNPSTAVTIKKKSGNVMVRRVMANIIDVDVD